MHLIENLVARAIFPPCFNVWPSLGGYKPREQYWDLDLSGRTPILLTLRTPFSTIQAYYIPPLHRRPSSRSEKLIVAYPGNTRAVGSLMQDFWSLFGEDVHLLLVNPCGYGNFTEDRSEAMVGGDARLLEVWLRGIAQTVEERLLRPERVEWGALEARSVGRGGEGGGMEFSPVADADLPGSFADMEVTVFGRSIGAFLASCHAGRPKIYYTPFQSVEKLEPAGMMGLLWRGFGGLAKFPKFAENQAFLDSYKGALEAEQRKFIGEYEGRVFTGLETDLVAVLSDGCPCLMLLASEDDVVGRLAGDFLEKVDGVDTARLITIEGRHNVLPNQECKDGIRMFLGRNA
ncbi:hypothetical protein V494_00489 [Pseudogymnoascus sp. VKM F-4513 (FW-928)]|nr:hypothetical protein V494_00489 [Pseudogymnoascus sp. VKM F-4513 (FW-928)]